MDGCIGRSTSSMRTGGAVWACLARLLRSVCVFGLPLGYDAELTTRWADLCHVCVHVCVPDSIVWEKQGRRAAPWVVCWGRPAALSEDIVNTKKRRDMKVNDTA